MKRFFTILICMVLLILCGCDEISSDTDNESSTVNHSTDNKTNSNSLQKFNYTSERLKTFTHEDFMNAFAKAATTATEVEPIVCNTPEKVYFRYSDKQNYKSYVLVWDKKSGGVTYACPDQFCEHDDCVFASSYLDYMLYYDGGLLICRRNEDGRQTLHTADANGHNVKKIFETKHTLSILGTVVYNSDIYLLLPEKTPQGEVIYRINEIRDGKAYPISPKDTDIARFAVTQKGIYCEYAESSLLVLTEDRFETSTEIAEKAMHFYVSDDHLIYSTLDHETFCDGEYLMAYNGDMRLIGDMLYFISEEDENELRRINVTDGTEEHVMFFKTDGINDDYNDYLVDPLGFVYTIASTYEDVLISGGSLKTEDHFMIYDIENEDGEQKVFVLE